jgi:cytidylate kinase
MSVVTISRLKGSGGIEIGRQVAKKLGFHFVTKETIEEIFMDYGYVQFKEVYESAPSFWSRFDGVNNLMMNHLKKVIQAIAKYGDAVIIGRGSFSVFPHYSDVLNVQLWAPFDVRVQRIMKRESITDQNKAENIVKSNDHIRKTFVEAFFHDHPDRASAFNIVIDTSKIPFDKSVNWIVEAANLMETKRVPNWEFTGDLKVDSILMGEISKVLD